MIPPLLRYADARQKPPAIPLAIQTSSPANGIDVESFRQAGQIPFPPFDGAALWAEIHRRALVTAGDDSAYLATIAPRLPCATCRPHWLEMLARTPPEFGAGYFPWTVARHNEVNARLGKPVISEDKARAIWSVSIDT